MSLQVPSNEDHEVLGSEYCSGYTDRFGKWNTGFYCPTLGTNEAVYCCGNSNYKYCCTKKDQVNNEIPTNLMLVVGVFAGILMAVAMVTAVSCFFCSCCLLYKKRHTSINGGPLYQMHCSSTGSGVANMYSFSNQNSSVTTPVDPSMGGHLDTLMELDYPMTATSVTILPRNGTDSPCSFPNSPHMRRAVTMDPCTIGNIQREDGLVHLSPSMSISFKDPIRTIDNRHNGCRSPPLHHSESICTRTTTEESLYRSTKF